MTTHDPKAATKGDILDSIYEVIASRRGADPETSYTAKLFRGGPPKMGQKVGEEAVEAVVEIIQGKPQALAEESADLLFHLMVAWAETGVRPDDVWRVLENRMGTSGVDEKKRRGKVSEESSK
ncbi:phosphoribosyl-ATP diphosphatase [Fodinicurvata sp. EGI_FJ10296]|uniref:phosphoribosyl-ATP diphosphatase n=1 Tax=Fodinicurvata sp. EGI_FJ10296 TaxID=3231908 RepID=UPI0034543C8E